jgi:hypothetical protein
MTALPGTVEATGFAVLAAPPPITRDGARRDAVRELSKQIYAGHHPSLIGRALAKVLEWISAAIDRAASVGPTGIVGLVVLLGLLVLAVVAIRLRIGPLARRHPVFPADDPAGPLSATEHRRRADALAAEGRWAEAVRERLRAIVRELEGRGVLDPRPARTALEVAAEAGAALPAVQVELSEAAELFDQIWYGGRVATAAADRQLRQVGDQVRAARPVLTAVGR